MVRRLPHPLANPRCHFSIIGISMTLTDLVVPNAIVPALKVNNKKQAIQELADKGMAEA